MIRTRLTALAVAAATVATVLASPAYADVDTDFSTQLHTYGIYGPRDYNAWIGKITCKRLDTGVDHDGYQSADFLAKNLPAAPPPSRRGSSSRRRSTSTAPT